MIFDCQDTAADTLSLSNQGLTINWLNREDVYDSNMHTFLGQLLVGFQSLGARHASGNNDDLIVRRLLDNFGLSNLELLVVLVDNGQCRTSGSNKSNSLSVRYQFSGIFRRDSIRRIQNNAAGDSTEDLNTIRLCG